MPLGCPTFAAVSMGCRRVCMGGQPAHGTLLYSAARAPAVASPSLPFLSCGSSHNGSPIAVLSHLWLSCGSHDSRSSSGCPVASLAVLSLLWQSCYTYGCPVASLAVLLHLWLSCGSHGCCSS